MFHGINVQVFLKLGPLIMRKISVGVGGEDVFLMWAFTLSPVAFLYTLEGADRNAGKRRGKECFWVAATANGFLFSDSSEISIGLFFFFFLVGLRWNGG